MDEASGPGITAWTIVGTEAYERRAKWYSKKRRAESIAVLADLDVLVGSLRSGKPPKPFVHGFLHAEPAGIIAIDQTGAGRKLAATRLYLYPDLPTDTLYLLTTGDKPSQSGDIQDCKRLLAQIKAGLTRQRTMEDEEAGEGNGSRGGSGG